MYSYFYGSKKFLGCLMKREEKKSCTRFNKVAHGFYQME